MTSSARSPSSRSGADRLLFGALRASAAVSGAVVLLIGGFLVLEALPALREIGFARFFRDASWHPSSGLYNLSPMIAGTLFAMTGAVLLATPLGILSAIFGRFYAPPRMATSYRSLVELLAGIPSVVYGLWGLMVLVPALGASLLAGILVLAVMIFPTIALSADAALAAVPRELRLGAAALGLSRWAAIRHVVLPAARSGLFTGAILGTGRALGETLAVLMVCGNVVRMPESLFDPVRTLTANIALEMAYALGGHRSALFVGGLLLLGMIVLLVAAADLVARRKSLA